MVRIMVKVSVRVSVRVRASKLVVGQPTRGVGG